MTTIPRRGRLRWARLGSALGTVLLATACTSSESELPALVGDELASVTITGTFVSGAPEGSGGGFEAEMSAEGLEAPGRWDGWMACGAERLDNDALVEERHVEGTVEGSYQVMVSDNLREDFTWVQLTATEEVDGPGEYAARLVFIPASAGTWPEVADGTLRIEDGGLGGEFEVSLDDVRITGAWECAPAD